MKKQILYIVSAIIMLLILNTAGRKIQQFLTKAAPVPANIIIDTNNIIGKSDMPWAAFSQGGEEPPPMLSKAIPLLRGLSPRYVRIDHIYDYYSIVNKKDSKFTYDFSKLDQTVNDILSSGALPFFSLSYMPSVFTQTGSVTDVPSEWEYWKDLIKATVEHYSGKNNRNLSDVYYEVWNEPELPQFGNWKLSKEKDYRLLYYYAERGASEASNVNEYRIGGPAVGSYYSSWVKDFLSYVSQNNLRLDFYSWHRYTKKPWEYVSDAKNIRKDIKNFFKYKDTPLAITEWGIESENSEINSSNSAAAFTINAASQFQSYVDLAFAFEVKDGPPPQGGKWGLITHENNLNNFLTPKPRYQAFLSLSHISGDRLSVSGEGTYVKSLSSSSSDKILALLSNYDISGQNTENVPVTFTGLQPSSYRLKYTYVLDRTTGIYEIPVTNGTINKTFIMPPNSIIELELTPVASLATFIPGRSNNRQDQALVLKNADPLVFAFPQFRLLPTGKISFYFKPLWNMKNNTSFFIFEAPFSTDSATLSKLYLSKQSSPSGNNLTFGVSENQQTSQISIPIDNWQNNQWYNISLEWNQNGLNMIADNSQSSELQMPLNIHNGKILKFYPIDAAIDDLSIINGTQGLERTFDGIADR